MRVIIRGSWAPYVGTNYCEALGAFDSLDDKDCAGAAEDRAWETWEDDDNTDEDGEYYGEGPDYYVEEYDPETHDMLRGGGGSFEDDFKRYEADERGPTIAEYDAIDNP